MRLAFKAQKKKGPSVGALIWAPVAPTGGGEAVVCPAVMPANRWTCPNVLHLFQPLALDGFSSVPEVALDIDDFRALAEILGAPDVPDSPWAVGSPHSRSD